MDQRVYVSTGAFQTRDLHEILKICSENGISHIELSANLCCDQSILSELIHFVELRQFKFLVHNYFPSPEVPFVLNLASVDSSMIERNRIFCKDAIRLCAKLKSPYYSVHAGYCFNALVEHLGDDLSGLKPVQMEEAKAIFIESMKIIADYAKLYNITVLIENNVLSSNNLVEGENKLLLGVNADDLIHILHRVERENIGLLLDVGHLYVSSKSLEFSIEKFIDACKPFIKCIHFSENDGRKDTNNIIKKDSWLWKPLKKIITDKLVFVLEAYNLPIKVIQQQISLISSVFH